MKALQVTRLLENNPLDIWQKRQMNFHSFLKGRLVVPLLEAIHMIKLDRILCLSADGNYSKIHLDDGTCILSSKTLKYFENVLINRNFLRIHAGYIVNLDRVTGICKEDGYCISLDNGDSIPISRAFKSQLFCNANL